MSIFGNLWSNLHAVPLSGFEHSKCTLSQARFPSWQLKLPSLILHTKRMEVVTTHCDHCYVTI